MQATMGRQTTADRGYGSKWQRERLVFLAHPDNQLCVKCKARGLLNPGTLRMDGTLETNLRRMGLRVDHKIPHRGDQRFSGTARTGNRSVLMTTTSSSSVKNMGSRRVL